MKCKVVFADAKLKIAFESLKASKTEDQKLYKWLNRAFDDIARDAFSGTQVPKRLMPKNMSISMRLTISGNITFPMRGGCYTPWPGMRL